MHTQGRSAFAVLLLTSTSMAHASDFGELGIVMLWQTLVLIWPLLLPVFFVGQARNTLKVFFVFALISVGVRGIISMPLYMYTNFAVWLGEFPDWLMDWMWLRVLIENVLALGLALSVLVGLGPTLRQALDD